MQESNIAKRWVLSRADDAAGRARTALLAPGIPVVDHLHGLERLPPYGLRFHTVPPAANGPDAFPVRAYALVGP